MKSYIIHDGSGNIVSCGITSSNMDQRRSESHVQVYCEHPQDIENYRFDVASQNIVRIDDSIIQDRQNAFDLELLRANRDSLLTSCDWTQSIDSPLTDAKKAEWATYRQALRDLPANTTDPANPTWPTQPS